MSDIKRSLLKSKAQLFGGIGRAPAGVLMMGACIVLIYTPEWWWRIISLIIIFSIWGGLALIYNYDYLLLPGLWEYRKQQKIYPAIAPESKKISNQRIQNLRGKIKP